MDWLFEFLVGVFGVRLINASPGMSRKGSILIAKSDWRQSLWTLGFAGRRVEVDPTKRIVHVFDRRFWLVRTSRRIEFGWVSEVTWGYTPISLGWWARQEYDVYAVGLRLKNGQNVHLFRFVGEGDFVNDSIWPDFLYWSDFLLADINRGGQTSLSQSYSEILGNMIGVPVVDPVD